MTLMDCLEKRRSIFEQEARRFNRQAEQGEITWAARDADPQWRNRLREQIAVENNPMSRSGERRF